MKLSTTQIYGRVLEQKISVDIQNLKVKLQQGDKDNSNKIKSIGD